MSVSIPKSTTADSWLKCRCGSTVPSRGRLCWRGLEPDALNSCSNFLELGLHELGHVPLGSHFLLCGSLGPLFGISKLFQVGARIKQFTTSCDTGLKRVRWCDFPISNKNSSLYTCKYVKETLFSIQVLKTRKGDVHEDPLGGFWKISNVFCFFLPYISFLQGFMFLDWFGYSAYVCILLVFFT